MGIRPSGTSAAGLNAAINRHIGSAYDNVKIVADNLALIQELSPFLADGDFQRLLDNLDEVLLADDNAAIAVQAAQSAEAFKNAASVSEANAAASALAASLSEFAAKVSEDAAKVSETNAKTSETNAQTAETGAETARDKAEQWASEPEDTEVETGKFSSLHYAAKALASAAAALVSENAALASATSAGASAVAAADSETNSENWATYPKTTLVPGESEYSSKHYALTSKDEADRAKGYADALSGTPIYQGAWDMSGGTLPPDQPGGFSGSQYYIVNVAGLAGGINWVVGDWCIWNTTNTAWEQIGSTSVSSVNGQTGIVVLDGSDLVFDPTGTNLIATDVDTAIKELDGRAESSIVHVVTGDFTIPTTSLENFGFTILHVNTSAPFVITIPDYDAPSAAVIEAFPLPANTGTGYITAAGAATSVAGDIYLPPDGRGYVRLVTDAQGARSKVWLPSSGRYVGTVFSSGHAATTDYTDTNSTGFTNTQALLDDMTAPAYLGRYLRRDVAASMAGRLSLDTTDSVKLPVGTEAQRGVGEAGALRFNSDAASAEIHNGTEWTDVGSGGGIPAYSIHTTGSALSIGLAEGYLINSVSVGSDVTVSLPIDSDGLRAGDWVSIGFYSTAPNKIIISSADHPIMGLNENFEMQTDYAVYTFSYVDATQGWKIVNAVGESEAPNAIMSSVANTFPAGTDTFSIAYDVGFVDVYVNGYLYSPDLYTATTGSEVVFNTPLLIESFVAIRGWNHVTVSEVTAPMVQYDNAASGLTATNVKTAIDEVWSGKPNDNLIINGDFSIWQRGTSFSGYEYGCDRWVGTSATVTRSLNTEHGASLRATRSLAGGALIMQPVELDTIDAFPTISPFNRGGTYTLSMKVVTANRIRPNIGYCEASGSGITTQATDTAFAYQGGGSDSIFQTLSWTFTVDHLPASADRAMWIAIHGETAGVRVEFFEVKLEEGSVATPFVPDSPQANLAKCLRYYWKDPMGNSTRYAHPLSDIYQYLGVQIDWPVPMRVAPTLSYGISGFFDTNDVQNETIVTTGLYLQFGGSGISSGQYGGITGVVANAEL